MKGKQEEAQPMGKVLSFVVLCIINATVCRKALEIDRNERIVLSKFPGLINGDDCCFPMRETSNWVKCAAMVGLKNSIGKTFFCKDFIEMNSRTFMLDYQDPDTFYSYSGEISNLHFIEIPFVNFGLVRGLLRSQQSDGDCAKVEKLCSLGECHNEMVRGLDFAYEQLDSLFFIENKKYLKKEELSGIPFYIPKWLGGLGLNPGPNFQNKISLEQRKQASLIFRNYESKKPKKISSLKTCLLDSKIEDLEKKLAYQNAINFEENFFTKIELQCGSKVDLEKENQEAYAALVEVLWRNLDMVDLKTDLEDENGNPLIAEFPNFNTNSKEFVGWQQELSRLGPSAPSFHDYKSQRKIMSDFKSNSKLWRSTYSQVLEDCSIDPLPWYKIWHERRRGLLPVVLRNPVKEYADWRQQVSQV